MHEHLLIGSDGFFLEFSTGGWVTHKLREVFLSVGLFQEVLAQREEASKLSQIVASDCLHLVKRGCIIVGAWLVLEDRDEDVDAFEVLRVVEVNETCLPELLLVHR